MVKVKTLRIPSDCSSTNAAGLQAAAVGSRSREQPVSGRDSAVPRAAAAGHETMPQVPKQGQPLRYREQSLISRLCQDFSISNAL